MDKDQLRQELDDLKTRLFNEGILNEYFTVLETIEDSSQPNFVENIISTYFSLSADYMDELEKTLDTKPLDLANVECLIHKLKGAAASIGLAKIDAIVGEMQDVFKAKKMDELNAAFEKIKVGHADLKMHLEPYVELLRMLRMENSIDDETSETNEDVESIGSNGVVDA